MRLENYSTPLAALFSCLLLLLSCKAPDIEDYGASALLLRESASHQGLLSAGDMPLVLIDGQPVWLSEFQRRLETISETGRWRFQGETNRRVLLQAIVALHLLAKMGTRLGLSDHPTVRQQELRTLASVVSLDRSRAETDCSFDQQELQRAYLENSHRYRRDEQLRLRLLLLDDPNLARELAASYRHRIHRDLASSLELFDQWARLHGVNQDLGLSYDLGFLSLDEASGSLLSSDIQQALELLRQPGDISLPIQTASASALLMLVERRAAFEWSLEEATADIRARLCSARRQASTDSWIAHLREQADIQVNQPLLSSLRESLQQPFHGFRRSLWVDSLEVRWHQRLTPETDLASLGAILEASVTNQIPEIEYDQGAYGE